MGPLAGVRVVELAGIGPAPFACMMLADLGAEVIQVVRAPRALAEMHTVLDRGRRRIELDLKDPVAVDAVLELVSAAHVVVEGFRPGVMERLGLGPEDCLRRNHKLVYARMTGWGQDGPLAMTAGHDINYLALCGALDTIGPHGAPPVPPVNLLGDFGGGATMLVTGILAGLLSGRGQVVDCSIVDGAASLLGMVCAMAAGGQWQFARGSNLLDGGAPFYSVYECADGLYIAVGAIEDRFYTALVEGLELDELPDRSDPRNWHGLRAVLAAAFKARTRDEWASHFEGTDACVTPVLTVPEAAQHPHLRARGTFNEVDGVLQPAPPLRFSANAQPAPEVR